VLVMLADKENSILCVHVVARGCVREVGVVFEKGKGIRMVSIVYRVRKEVDAFVIGPGLGQRHVRIEEFGLGHKCLLFNINPIT
ncbi:hypothetical protein HAX54_000982, partial [Datura stramonium]|nr:hypothetical protein [Datura stramonium]